GVSYTADGFAKGRPLNHIGVEVDDLAGIEKRVVAAGLRPFGHADYAPGRRFYFLDPDGIEYEVVSYSLSISFNELRRIRYTRFVDHQRPPSRFWLASQSVLGNQS